jgi:hypothetical protein
MTSHCAPAGPRDQDGHATLELAVTLADGTTTLVGDARAAS